MMRVLVSNSSLLRCQNPGNVELMSQTIKRCLASQTYITPDQVKHNPGLQIFYVDFIGDERAVIRYKPINESTWNLYNTEVPPVFRNLGIAHVMAKVAFRHCVRNKINMKLTCKFLQKYYSENTLAEYTALVVE